MDPTFLDHLRGDLHQIADQGLTKHEPVITPITTPRFDLQDHPQAFAVTASGRSGMVPRASGIPDAV